MRTVNGWLLPKGINTRPRRVIVPVADASMIADMIGCKYIDVMYAAVRHDRDMTHVAGYVDDEALLKPHGLDDVNHLAMFMLRHDDAIIGDVIVVGATSPTGEVDGEDYDLPDWIMDNVDSFVEDTAVHYNESMGLTMLVIQALGDGMISEEELIQAVKKGADEQEFEAIAKVAMRYGEIKSESDVDPSVDIAEGFEELLKGIDE